MGDSVSSEEQVVSEEIILNNGSEKTKNDKKTEVIETSSTKSKKQSKFVIDSEEIAQKNLNFSKNIFVVFIECESSGNIGFLARTMANFGLNNLVLINPCTLEKDAYYQAMHAKSIVENSKQYNSLHEFFVNQEIDFIIGSTGTPGGSYNLSRIPINPEQLRESVNLNSKIAILFGREGDGMTNKEISLCDLVVSIPTNLDYPIMNISHAAAIIFYELFKGQFKFDVIGLEEANSLEKEYLLKDMENIISKLSMPQHKERTALKSFKNIINRAFITGREAHTLKGILRKIKEKL